MLGPLDILAGLIGSENLAMSLYTEPEEVVRCAADAAEFFMQIYDAQVAMIRDAGLTEGIGDWMRMWLPGRGVCYSEDFSALCGEAHFRQFFFDANAGILKRLDSGMLHIHSGAAKCLPAIVELPGLAALELSNDPSGPKLGDYVNAAKSVQRAGLPMQTSNWEHPLSDDEIDYLRENLNPRGLRVSLQASSIEQACAYYDTVKGIARA
jgi:hypothetical protein